MNPIGRIRFILAATLLVNSFASMPAIAQQDEAVARDKRIVELYQAGKFSKAMLLAQRSLAIRENALGPDHPGVATSLNTLAELYRAQGRYADAEPLFRRSRAIREEVLGSGHPNFAQSLNNPAMALLQPGSLR